jgi:hypothetical protein
MKMSRIRTLLQIGYATKHFAQVKEHYLFIYLFIYK